jgi:hypothetical protein
MDFNELKVVDLKLLLDKGRSIKTGNLDIVPYTLEEVTDYGYTKYMNNIQFISLTISDLLNSIKDEKKREFLESQENLKTFDCYMLLGNGEIKEILLDTIAMIFKTEDVRMIDNNIAINFLKLGILKINDDGEVIVNEDCELDTSEENLLLVNRDNFDDIVRIVKLQNFLVRPDNVEVEVEDDLSHVDEATRKLIEQQRKLDEKVEKIKRQQLTQEESDIDIADIINAVASKSNSLNELNIWHLTIYQLYRVYERLEKIDNYDFSVRAIMAGANPKEINLQHWSS